ncbi:MAG: hypothetical protein WC133_02070 [Candidatus Omnitrophota bacterium]
MVTIAFHKDMTIEKWASKPVSWQVLSIASEMGRAESSLKGGLWEPFKASLERTLELIDLTVEANLSNGEFVLEMLRFREVLAGFYMDPAKAPVAEFKSLTKVLLTLDPGAYNLLGVTL